MLEGLKSRRLVLGVLALTLALGTSAAGAATIEPDDGLQDRGSMGGSNDPSDALSELDGASNVVSGGPSAKVTKNLAVAGRGERLVPNATTDVWAHQGTAYIGTFNDPCGTGEGFRSDTGPVSYIQDRAAPGVAVFDVKNVHKPTYIGNLPSVAGSRVNDVKVAEMNSGTILVHSNEACAGGDGGFEIYEMSDPRNPVHLASARVDDPNETLRTLFGDVNVGVHNLYLFTQGDRDYVGMQTHAFFGSFQIYELTDPTNPQFTSAWGAELLCEEAYCSADPYNETDPNVLVNHINGYMFGLLTPAFGFSQNRFLHDVTVSDDGTKAYLSHWDAGLILLDVSDPANPEHVSTALDVANGSLDGEVNSHAAWPTEDGRFVVETEEDFDAIVSDSPLSNFTFGETATNTIPGFGISTVAGDAFEGSQTGNQVTIAIGTTHHGTGITVQVTSGPLAGNVYAANEGAGNQPKFADVGPQSGEGVWIGRACNIDPILNAGAFDPGDIAIVRRGECTFAEKLANAAALGADAIVVSNNVREDTPWGGVRIWDYTDPENPVLASTFNTTCSADPHAESCDPRGTYSVHNVIVEKGKAYLSWYSDGVLVLDIKDPYKPVEVARYNETGDEFEMMNGGIQDVWGIHKEPGKPWLYASDRNGGLYVLKEYGAGSATKGNGGK